MRYSNLKRCCNATETLEVSILDYAVGAVPDGGSGWAFVALFGERLSGIPQDNGVDAAAIDPCWEVVGVDRPKEVEHNPICPYCDREIPYLNLHTWRVRGIVLQESGRIGAFSCPNCKKFLGVASVAWGKE